MYSENDFHQLPKILRVISLITEIVFFSTVLIAFFVSKNLKEFFFFINTKFRHRYLIKFEIFYQYHIDL